MRVLIFILILFTSIHAQTNLDTIKYNKFTFFLSDVDFIGGKVPEYKIIKPDKSKDKKKIIKKKDAKKVVKKKKELMSSDEGQLYKAGKNLFNAMQYQESGDIFIELLQKYPDSKYKYGASFYIAELKYNTAKYDDAMMYYNKIINDFKKSSYVDDAYYKKALIFYKKGDYRSSLKSVSIMQEKLKRSPLMGDSYVLKGSIYEKLKNYNHAINSYKYVINKYPKSKNLDKTYYHLGLIYKEIPHVRNLELSASYFQNIVDNYKDSPYHPKADAELTYLKENFLDYK